MSRSFGLVEEKLREAKFFLDLLRNSARMSFDSRCYFSAFTSAARSVTFSLQSSLHGIEGFESWYESNRRLLKDDPLATFFVDVRNKIQKTGENPLNEVPLSTLPDALRDSLWGSMRDRQRHIVAMPDLDDTRVTILVDAVQASEDYFRSLVGLVFKCYETFLCVVDPRWYFTEKHFAEMGKTFVNALAESGFPEAWGAFMPDGCDGWRVLRSQHELCPLNDLFQEYLAKQILDPDG